MAVVGRSMKPVSRQTYVRAPSDSKPHVDLRSWNRLDELRLLRIRSQKLPGQHIGRRRLQGFQWFYGSRASAMPILIDQMRSKQSPSRCTQSLCRPAIHWTAEHSMRAEVVSPGPPKTVEAIVFRPIRKPIALASCNAPASDCGSHRYVWKARRHYHGADLKRSALMATNVIRQCSEVSQGVHALVDINIGSIQ